MTLRAYLDRIKYTRQEVDDWLAGRAFGFATYDPELGWLARDWRAVDGVDGSTSTYRYGPYGERRTIHYADRPCRINTYGDSYTKCHQVSDGETWQEVLAAHLCEPVRNLGVGGWSVYQAYRRMLREEARVPAQMLVLNIYYDDHYRNLDAWRNVRQRKHPVFIEPPLPHIRVNLTTGECRECENPCPTAESLYHLCDVDWLAQRFGDDFALHIVMAREFLKAGDVATARALMQRLVEPYGIDIDLPGDASLAEAIEGIHTRAALRASMYIVDRVEALAREQDKRVLYVLSYSRGRIAQVFRTRTRFDQAFLDFLAERGLPFVDLLAAHIADFRAFSIDIEEYLKRFFVGHYGPLGNFFTAFAVKDKLVERLEPRPPAYRAP